MLKNINGHLVHVDIKERNKQEGLPSREHLWEEYEEYREEHPGYNKDFNTWYIEETEYWL